MIEGKKLQSAQGKKLYFTLLPRTFDLIPYNRNMRIMK